MFTFTINGEEFETEADGLEYETVVSLIGDSGSPNVDYWGRGISEFSSMSGNLDPGQKLMFEQEGRPWELTELHFTCIHANKA